MRNGKQGAKGGRWQKSKRGEMEEKEEKEKKWQSGKVAEGEGSKIVNMHCILSYYLLACSGSALVRVFCG